MQWCIVFYVSRMRSSELMLRMHQVGNILKTALTDRVSHVRVRRRAVPLLLSGSKPSASDPPIIVHVSLNAEAAGRQVDVGPAADAKDEVKAYRCGYLGID